LDLSTNIEKFLSGLVAELLSFFYIYDNKAQLHGNSATQPL